LKTTFKIAGACFVIVIFLFLWKGEGFLTINNADDCNNVDAVIVLGGGFEDLARVKEGVAVAESRETRYLILPSRHSAITWKWLVDAYNIETDLDAKDVLIGTMESEDKEVSDRYGSTYLEAEKSIQIMLENYLNSAIVVSSGYHMRRSRLAFETAKENHPIQFCYHPIPKQLSKSPWWLDLSYVQRVVIEYGKLVGMGGIIWFD
jgi:hypothetical protein